MQIFKEALFGKLLVLFRPLNELHRAIKLLKLRLKYLNRFIMSDNLQTMSLREQSKYLTNKQV